jgi:hypothetical protein
VGFWDRMVGFSGEKQRGFGAIYNVEMRNQHLYYF